MYITTYVNPLRKQQTKSSYLSLITGTSENNIEVIDNPTNEYHKVTYKIGKPNPITHLSAKQQINMYTITTCIDILFKTLYLRYNGKDLNQFYYEFKIPKASGGLRTINAPNEEFKADLNKIKELFESIIKCLPHDSAFAYVKNRDTKQELQRHTNNGSKWFLKIDLKDFFPSCTLELIMFRLRQLYPFYYLDDDTMTKLEHLISLCMLNGGLPQGTPTSPLLTNLIMVSYDYEISEFLRKCGAGYIYTRYADDILISNKGKFKHKDLLGLLEGILQPFHIKEEKTRFGNSNGRNWNLGLMVNKDNNITLGYKKKQLLNAMLNNFLRDASKNQYWSRDDTYYLQGQLSYLKHIEPEYYDYIITKYETKHHVCLSTVTSDILNPRV